MWLQVVSSLFWTPLVQEQYLTILKFLDIVSKKCKLGVDYIWQTWESYSPTLGVQSSVMTHSVNPLANHHPPWLRGRLSPRFPIQRVHMNSTPIAKWYILRQRWYVLQLTHTFIQSKTPYIIIDILNFHTQSYPSHNRWWITLELLACLP